MRHALLLLLAATATMAAAADTVYRSVDEAGRPLFTDQPDKGAKPVEVPPTNTVQPVEPRPVERPRPAAFAGYDRVHLGIPAIVPNGLAPTEVRLETSPDLLPGHRWRLLIDGALVAEQEAPAVTLEQLARGQHVAEAEVVDDRGAVVGQSVAVEFFVYWPGGANR